MAFESLAGILSNTCIAICVDWIEFLRNAALDTIGRLLTL